MTKQEWLDCKNINLLFKEVSSQRKRQLFALACCRSIEHLIRDQQSKDCLEKLELFIDGKIDEKELKSARQKAVYYDAASLAVAYAAANDWAACWASADCAVLDAVIGSNINAALLAATVAREKERIKQIESLKDIYNPFVVPLTFPQKAVQLAEEVYEKRDITTRLILSDFLEEHHFPEELYLHLKQPTHCKGCWVIDQILKKS